MSYDFDYLADSSPSLVASAAELGTLALNQDSGFCYCGCEGETAAGQGFLRGHEDVLNRKLADAVAAGIKVAMSAGGELSEPQPAIDMARFFGWEGEVAQAAQRLRQQRAEMDVEASSVMSPEDTARFLGYFRMPKPVSVMGRKAVVTNSFVSGVIPTLAPTAGQVREALNILDMADGVSCAYCGDPSTEWDHLRPLVVDKRPTGYVSEIHNLVPACGKCNQSKGNKPWRTWMFGPAPRSPKSRGVPDLDQRAQRLGRYEAWMEPTRLDFEAVAGSELWSRHWANHESLIELMREAEVTAAQIRATVKAAHLQGDS